MSALTTITPSIADEKPTLGFPPVIKISPDNPATGFDFCFAGTALAAAGGLAYLLNKKNRK